MKGIDKRLAALEESLPDPDPGKLYFNEREGVYYVSTVILVEANPIQFGAFSHEAVVDKIRRMGIGFYEIPGPDEPRYTLADLKGLAAKGALVEVLHYDDVVRSWAGEFGQDGRNLPREVITA